MSENTYNEYVPEEVERSAAQIRAADDEWTAVARAEAAQAERSAAQIRADREDRRLAAALDAPAEGPTYIVTRTIVSTMQGGPHTPVESAYYRGRSLPRAMAAMAQAAEGMDDHAPWTRTIAVRLTIA